MSGNSVHLLKISKMKKIYFPAFTVFIFLVSLSAKAQVVINEVYGGGGNSGTTYKNDFIELYNNGDAAVTVSGWTVQYASATGTTWATTILSGSIPPKSYYLIQQAAGTGGTTNLPTPNATGNLSLSGTTGKVALVNNSTALSGSCPTGTQIIDLVGFGTATCFEGAVAPAPSNTTSIQRTPTGTDTNNNSTDFKTGSPSPTASGATADVTPPTITASSPANNATNVAISVNATLNFAETVKKGTGNINLKKFSDNTIIKTIDVTSSEVSVSDKSVTFSYSGLSENTGYFIEIAAGAFKDTANNDFAGISGNSTLKFTTGRLLLNAAFGVCSSALTEGFTQYSITGDETWACTTFGRDSLNSPSGSAPNGIQINGFSGGTNVPNEDWLISPPLNLTATTYPLLTFYSRTAFNGSPLQLKVSTNYSGSGDPRLATWTDIEGRFPSQASDTWTLSSQINLSAFKQSNVYFAFVYKATAEEGARWTLDDISIDNSLNPPSANLATNTSDIQFGYAASGSSTTKTLVVTGNDITSDITLTSSANFLLSLNGTDFSYSITSPQAAANNKADTIFVRFNPTRNDTNYNGTVTVASSGLTTTINLTGTSIDPGKTLEIVNWNIEWFGSSANGPANDSLQEQNVKKIFQNIGADLYALVEIVDTTRLGNVVRSMPGYSYVVSNYGSHTNPTVTGDGPLSEAQKLGFVYKTSMFSNITTTPLLNLATNTAGDAASKNYDNWSSGRYPFMMNADVTLHGITKNIKFIVIHAKANTSPTVTSYNRRKEGADSLYKLLNTTYPTDNIIILGDFNDDFDSTITSGITPRITSYSSFVNDSVNYPTLTLPLSRVGKKSSLSFSDMIDHVVVSNEMRPFYISGSASVLTDVTSLVSNYGSTTTDHYPVYSRYAFDGTSLPTKLIEFSAAKKASSVDLTWKTAQEINSKEFVIERSADGINFNVIGTVAASGGTSSQQNYFFTDNSPYDGYNYYRLRQVDKDNKQELSKVLNVILGSGVTVSFSPNPAKDVVNITLNNVREQVLIQLVDINGKIVAQQLVNNGATRTALKLNAVSKGLYLLKIIDNKTVITEKLMIQ